MDIHVGSVSMKQRTRHALTVRGQAARRLHNCYDDTRLNVGIKQNAQQDNCSMWPCKSAVSERDARGTPLGWR